VLPWVKLLAVVALIGAALRLEQRQPRLEASGAARIIDGDSLVVGGTEVRLKHIDAPEGRQTCRRDGADWRCGEAAAQQLRQLATGRVACRGTRRDRFNRLLAVCTAGARELNRGMVAAGWAVAFGGYEAEELVARQARKGIWASEFQRPQDWRAANQDHND
jgi:endonuclease YncB( thermonuclease family)